MNGGGIVETPSGKVAVLGAAALLAGLCVCLSAGACSTQVVRVVYDGDTLGLEDGTRVRLVGVDAPEVDSPYSHEEPFGRESREFMRSLVLGKRVRVSVCDPPLDRYGRTLAYVYVDDVLVNGRIIREGWAMAYRRFPHPMRDLFITYEMEAKARRLGMWRNGPRQGKSARRASRISGALKPDHERGLPFLRPLRNTCS
jgi:micrococcal nuclease